MKIKAPYLTIHVVCAMMLGYCCVSAYANEPESHPTKANVSFNKGELFLDTVKIKTGSNQYLQILDEIRTEAIKGSVSHSLFLAKFLKSKENAVGSWNLNRIVILCKPII